MTDQKGKKKFIPRQAENKAEIIYFRAIKPNNCLYLICIEKCKKVVDGEKLEMLHINLYKEKDGREVTREIYFTINEEDQSEKSF